MKNYLLIFLFCIGGWTHAQQETNPFSNAEQNNGGALRQEDEPEAIAYDIGNPPGGEGNDDPVPVPVDNYIPLLILTAAGIIIYKTHNKTNISS